MSLRDRIRKRERASTTFPLRVEDDIAARAALAEAIRDGGDTTEAQAAVDACYEQLRIVALPPADMEALITEHPPTEEQRATAKRLNGSVTWNAVTFLPALLAACIEGDITEEDWVEFSTKGPMTSGEVQALFDTVLSVNYRTPDPHLGKD